MFYGPGLAHHKLAMTLIGLQHRALVALCYGIAFISSLGLRANAAPPANDHFTNAISIAGIISVSATNVGATAELGEPAHADVPAADVAGAEACAARAPMLSSRAARRRPAGRPPSRASTKIA